MVAPILVNILSSNLPNSILMRVHTLQALVERVYVKEANDLLGAAMPPLQQALTLNKSAMDTLTNLQNLHNAINVVAKGSFDFNYSSGSSVSDYESTYTMLASAFFGTPIDPFFIFSAGSPSFPIFQSQLLITKKQIQSQIKALSDITPFVNGQPDPTSLYSRMQIVLSDLNAYNLNSYQGCQQWVLDNYDVHGSAISAQAGQIQNNITLAITASQSLNDQQKEQVRRYLFAFEEYYKSAASYLSTITQIITRMAQGISR